MPTAEQLPLALSAAVRPAVFTIPAHRAFADALAAGIIARWGGSPLELARGIVILPNNRAQRALTDAFVRRAEGGLLLPRLIAIGDDDLDERIGPLFDPAEGESPPPPAIDPLDRQMRLARLVQLARRDAGVPVDAAEAVRLAADLARTLDQLIVEEVDPRRLGALEVAPELSAHWARALDLLAIILDRWPRELAEIGRIDRATRRNLLLHQTAERWKREAPPGFVVAAGVTVAAPAVAALLKTIAWLKRGMVVLPGFDQAMPEDEWEALGPFPPESGRRAAETHPQFNLKLLLDRMDIAPGEVERWRWGGGHDASAARGRAVNNALKPARFTGKWHELDAPERLLTGVRTLEAATPAEEAQAIAIALREALETPERTAALVTPDRGLARRVSALLRRWGIAADDSAGAPLSMTPPGALLLGLADAAAQRLAPPALLAVLKHPLVRAGEGRLAWLEGVRALDLALRGPRPAEGSAGLAAFLRESDERTAKLRERARPFWDEAASLLAPLEAAFRDADGGRLEPLLAALRDVATGLCGDAIWSGPAGRAAADLLSEAERCAANGPREVSADGVGPLLRRLMDDVAVRPPQGGHPRISIWGLIEARLQQADLMILGGLNEGTWPSVPAPDPWLAPRIRSELRLPGLDRRIGLAAHDFAGALGAPEVIVTRAHRDTAPTVASRFWLRLAAIDPADREHRRADRFVALARQLDRAQHKPASRPAPVPPVAERPTRISVTEVDRLKADPYAFYARRMLRLSPLDMIDADPTPAWRGTAIHAVLEAWARDDGCMPEKLRDRARAMLAGPGSHPLVRALWEPRLMEAVNWIAETIVEMRTAGRIVATVEAKGAVEIGGITLDGRVDRIDRLADGSLAIVDYKTGTPPSARAVRAGYSLQLGLLGLIAERSGFGDVGGKAGAFEYWSMARRKKGQGFGYIETPVDPDGARGKIPTDDFVGVAAANFIEAAEKWLAGEAAFTAKLHPEFAPYAEYDQLMRLDEWYGRDG
ncbi:ATP-dependent helicase/nuclease subunit B [Sphingomonas zeicaulis]